MQRWSSGSEEMMQIEDAPGKSSVPFSLCVSTPLLFDSYDPGALQLK